MKHRTDVLVCGAGAAGLTLAVDLARRGVNFRLIEKLPGPFAGSRGKGIQPRTLEIFEDLGLLDRLAATGGPYPPERRYLADGSHIDAQVVAVELGSVAEPYRQPLMAPQFLTEGALRESLAELGFQPDYGCELLGFEQDADGVTARVRSSLGGGEQTIQARWLVGADGGRSFVRHALAIEFPGKTLGVRAIVADVLLTGLERDAWHRYSDGDIAAQISFCPLAGTNMFQVQGPVALEGEIDLSVEGMNRLIAERTGRSDIVVHAVSWASAYGMNARLAARYRAGRVFLVGDAAHIHPPTGGQGLNTSVQDAYNLGWKLAAVADGAPEALLDTYEEERRPVAAAMLGLSTGLLEAQKRGEMRRGREVHQLDIGYRNSSLTLGAVERGVGLLAGDRAPDALVRGAAGQPVRLFHLLRGPHWTLLGYHVHRAGPAARAGLHIHRFGADLLDDLGQFQAAYGANHGDWLLIRPDGYVGAIVRDEDLTMLHRYLDRVFPA